MTPVIDHYSVNHKEHFINDQQWVTLAHLHLRSEIPIRDILDGLHLEPNINMPDDQQNFVGRIPTGKTSFLYGMLHYSGSTHT